MREFQRHRRDAKGAKKNYSENNALSKKILETAMEMLRVKGGVKVVSYSLIPLRTLRLETSSNLFLYLGRML